MVAAVGGAGLGTAVFSALPCNTTTAGFGYLILVLAIATAWGLKEAVAASVAAMMCFNFFFMPPVGRLTIADPQNWMALFPGIWLIDQIVHAVGLA